MNNTIIQAIEEMKYLEFDYDGNHRIVQPHTFGVSTTGKETVRAYQTEGYSENPLPGWRPFTVEKIKNLDLSSRHFTQPAPGYAKGDSMMTRIFAEI